jgi:hypothetical protein
MAKWEVTLHRIYFVKVVIETKRDVEEHALFAAKRDYECDSNGDIKDEEERLARCEALQWEPYGEVEVSMVLPVCEHCGKYTNKYDYDPCCKKNKAAAKQELLRKAAELKRQADLL